MVNVTNNMNDGRTILANPHNICCVDWWSRDDIENHIDRPLTDEEWGDVSNRLEKSMSADTELLVICLDEVGVK